jgi:signal transduction histidine kinase
MIRSLRRGLTRPGWLRLPHRTARLRLTLLYSGLFLACGVALLTITYVLSKAAIDKTAVRIPASSGVRTLVPVHPAEPAPGSPAAASLAATDRELLAQRASDLRHLLVNSGIALGFVSVLSVLLGWFVAGRVLRPLRTITTTARRISASNLDERLALESADLEFRELGDTLDELFARLQAAFQAQRHFVANASHELRTPLAWEQTLLQVALADPDASSTELRETCVKVLAASKEQQGLVEALLTLASSERELDRREPVDLSALANAVLLSAQPAAEHQHINITVATDAAMTNGHPALLERLLGNLIDNAISHNVPDGLVRVETDTTVDHRARLLVSNSGPEIPASDIDRLFEPFQRHITTRSNGPDGHGLGLSIVAAIARAHRASVTARPRPGGGLDIEVAFPPVTAPKSRDPRRSRHNRWAHTRPS